MAWLGDVQPASSQWYVSDLDHSLQFHNHGIVIIAILVLSIVVLITILFFHFLRQYRQLSSSRGGTSSSITNAVGVGVAVQTTRNNNTSKGLDEATINSFPIFLHSSLSSTTTLVVGENYTNNNNECSICLGGFEENDRIKVIPRCMHVFHCECVDKWLQNQASCPLCRSNLDSISSSTTALQICAA
ncbi:hypothetical protein ACH5RR_020629 [Cinchona calisaya]|uniref:RING-type E3 ubiquitin transferase n=1 Tax=Cinchona calisaya TaxID=153742 RepID=A0ABD2ZIH9_9GENT